MVIRIAQYPYWHGRRNYINFCPLPRDRTWTGYSECEIIENLQGELNAIRNQRIDCGTIANSPMFEVLNSVRRDPNRPWYMPGAIIRVDTKGSITPIVQQGVGQSAFAEQSLVLEAMQDVSGMNAYALGQSPSRSRTAGEVSQVVAAGNEKLNVLIDRMARSFQEAMRQVLALDYQFLPPELEHAIIGNPGKGMMVNGQEQPQPRLFNKITRDALNKGYRIHVVGNTANTNKELMIQAAETLYQISQTSPLIQIDAVRLWNVLYNYLQQVGIVDPTPYIGTEAQAAMFQQQKESQPKQTPIQPISLSGKIGELETLALVLQQDPSLAPIVQQVIQMWVTATAQANAMVAATQPQVPYSPVDPNQGKIAPETVSNNQTLAGILGQLTGGGQNGQQPQPATPQGGQSPSA
jgi:hypothetical protein